MDDSAKIEIGINDAERILYGIQRAAEAFNYDIFSYTTEGVLHEDETLDVGKNAEDWIRRYYELTAGVLTLIEGATGIITRALTDGDLRLVGKEAKS